MCFNIIVRAQSRRGPTKLRERSRRSIKISTARTGRWYLSVSLYSRIKIFCKLILPICTEKEVDSRSVFCQVHTCWIIVDKRGTRLIFAIVFLEGEYNLLPISANWSNFGQRNETPDKNGWKGVIDRSYSAIGPWIKKSSWVSLQQIN